MKKGNTISSRKTARLSFLVVWLMGLRLFSGEAFAYPECNAPDIELGDYTIAACNIGTTIAGTGEESYGAYFQWGNNYGFTTGIVAAPMNDKVDASAFGPGNYYYSGVFHPVDGSPYDWDVSMNPNKWGGSGDEATKNGVGTDLDRQGPCASGYHIPSTLEWYEFTCGWLGLQGENCPSVNSFVGDDDLIYSFSNAFLLPFAGEYHYTTVILTNPGSVGNYMSSSAGDFYNMDRLIFELSRGVAPQVAAGRTYGMSLRCFKNDIRNEVCNRVTDISKAECKALVDFYYSTNGDGWTKGYSGRAGEAGQIGRLTGTKAGNWWGITVSGGNVLAMGNSNRLSNNDLNGTLNSSLGNLTEIGVFYIHSNPNLVGTLPKELKSWKKLKTLYIPSNGFDEELPPELSEWESIELFGIWDNKFRGTLPPEYAQRTTIKSFYPENNNFEGELPPEYGAWNLLHFTASNNKLSGILPESYGNWTSMQRFEVANNQLYGTIPESYGNWLGTGRNILFGFNIQNNMLSGDIPEGFKNWSSINENISISNNCLNTDLTGDIGAFLDLNAIERPFSGNLIQNGSKILVGSGWRLTQTYCLPKPIPTAPSYGGGGGGGGSLSKDSCPNGDFSPSYYDGTCGNKITEDGNQKITEDSIPTTESGIQESSDNHQKESSEILLAYNWAFQHNITTLSPIENANLTGPLLRSHMAKMIVNYVAGITPPSLRDTSPAVLREGKQRNLSIMQVDENENKNNELPLFLSRSTAGVAEGGGAIAETGCNFSDIANQTQELQTYITLACQLGLMGIHTDGTPLSDFMPNKVVSRAEFGTVLSRILWGDTYNDAKPYYTNHLQALKNNGIMTQIDNPEQRKEVRQRVRLMLMRSSEK